MSYYNETSVKDITEKLMLIAKLKPGDKLSVSAGEVKIQAAWSWPLERLQGIQRFNDKRQDTFDFLETLYDKAVKASEMICNLTCLDIVNLPGKTYMASAEDDKYREYKAHIDTLCMWIEKSIVGLESLKITYPDVPCFLTLIDKSQRSVKTTKTFLAGVEKNYKKMRILSSLEIVEERDEKKEEKKDDEKKRDSSYSSISGSSLGSLSMSRISNPRV